MESAFRVVFRESEKPDEFRGLITLQSGMLITQLKAAQLLRAN